MLDPHAVLVALNGLGLKSADVSMRASPAGGVDVYDLRDRPAPDSDSLLCTLYGVEPKGLLQAHERAVAVELLGRR